MNKTFETVDEYTEEAAKDYGEGVSETAGCSVSFSYEDLKAFAGKHCRDIYMSYHVSQVSDLPKSVQSAWETGKQIYALDTRN